MDIKKDALELQPFLTGFRHDLHMHPELSMQEFRTTEQFARKLEEWGIAFQRFEPTGLMTELVGKEDGPLIRFVRILMPCRFRRRRDFLMRHRPKASCTPAVMILMEPCCWEH